MNTREKIENKCEVTINQLNKGQDRSPLFANNYSRTFVAVKITFHLTVKIKTN